MSNVDLNLKSFASLDLLSLSQMSAMPTSIPMAFFFFFFSRIGMTQNAKLCGGVIIVIGVVGVVGVGDVVGVGGVGGVVVGVVTVGVGVGVVFIKWSALH